MEQYMNRKLLMLTLLVASALTQEAAAESRWATRSARRTYAPTSHGYVYNQLAYDRFSERMGRTYSRPSTAGRFSANGNFYYAPHGAIYYNQGGAYSYLSRKR